MVYSATSAAAAVGGHDSSYYLKRQGIFVLLGIVAMIALVLVLAAMLLVSGAPVGLLARAGVLVAGLGLLVIYLEPYRRARMFAFVDPWHDSQGAGFQIVQAMIGLGSGGVFGVGL